MSGRACIITGGNLSAAFLLKYMKETSYTIIIAVDGALEIVHRLGICPDYIVGDFDTVNKELLKEYEEQKILRHPPEKDQTDTELAIETAVQHQCRELVLLGATGTRLDHSLANIFLLQRLLEKNIQAVIADDCNRLYLKNNSFTLKKQECYGRYLSLLPLTEKVEQVTLTGFKYPVQGRTFFREYTLGVSNEITEEEARVEFSEGIFIVVESKDKER